MALRILHRTFIARSIHTWPKLLSQAQTQEDVEKSTTGNKEESVKNERWFIKDEPDLDVDPPLISENNPVNHNESHVGYFYRIPTPVLRKLMLLNDSRQLCAFPKEFLEQAMMFHEAAIMVRKPTLEIINNLKRADYQKPALRQVLYGHFGMGKSLSLAHIVHYGYKAGFLLVHVPWTNIFYRAARSVQPSIFEDGAFDVPIDGSNWLKRFLSQNSHLLTNPELVTTEHYQWNDHEFTEIGTPLAEMVGYGINRMLFSSRIIDVLLKEIKAHTTAGRCRTLVVIDGFNGFYAESVIDIARVTHKGRLSFAKAFLNLTKFDWCNASVVVSVDALSTYTKREDHTYPYKPFEILGHEGWDHLDPFIPIEIGKYTNAEAQNVLEYFVQKKWLVKPVAKTPEGREELIALSSLVPRELFVVCNPL